MPSPISALDPIVPPLTALLERVIPDPAQREQAKLQLLTLQGSQDVQMLQTQLSAILAEARSTDPWTSRARPSFMYVMYVMILWSLPMGIVAAFRPDVAQAIGRGMNAYLSGIPEPLYALFGTGYIGYTAARQWGKIAGSDK